MAGRVMRLPTARIRWGLLTLTLAAGCHSKAGENPPTELVVAAEVLKMGDRSCPLAAGGCDVMLAKFPSGALRLTASGEDLFGVLTPVLGRAAVESRAVTVTDLKDEQEVLPTNTARVSSGPPCDPDAPGVRLRIIVRADGISLPGARSGKVLGADSRGPTLVPTEKGQDLAGGHRKLGTLKKESRSMWRTSARCSPAPTRPSRRCCRWWGWRGTAFPRCV